MQYYQAVPNYIVTDATATNTKCGSDGTKKNSNKIDYSYEQLIKKLERAEEMLQEQKPGSKKHEKILKKRNEYKAAMKKTKEYQIRKQEKNIDKAIERQKLEWNEDKEKERQERLEQLRNETSQAEAELRQYELLIEQKLEEKRLKSKKQDDEEEKEQKNYTYKQLINKIKKVEEMMEGRKPGSKKYKQLEIKHEVYTAAIQQTKEYKLQKQKEETERALEEQRQREQEEEEQKRREEEANESDTERDGDDDDSYTESDDDDEDELTYMDLAMEIDQLQKRLETKEPGTDIYNEMKMTLDQYVLAIEKTEEYQLLKQQDEAQEEVFEGQEQESENDRNGEMNEEKDGKQSSSAVILYSMVKKLIKDAKKKRRSSHLLEAGIRVKFADDDGLERIKEFDPDWCVMSMTNPEVGEGEDYDQVDWEDMEETCDLEWWDLEEMGDDALTTLCKKVMAKGDYELTQQRIDRVQGHVFNFALKLKNKVHRRCSV